MFVACNYLPIFIKFTFQVLNSRLLFSGIGPGAISAIVLSGTAGLIAAGIAIGVFILLLRRGTGAAQAATTTSSLSTVVPSGSWANGAFGSQASRVPLQNL